MPVFWACATDAVGFGSLYLAKVGPVQDFGIMMAVGSLLVLLSVVLLLPGMALLGRIDPDPKRAWGEGSLGRGLDGIVRSVDSRPKTIGLAILILSTAAIAGSYRLEVETDFTKNFRAGTPIVRSYQFVETHLGGAGIWDLIVPAPPRLDWDYLRRVRRLEERLRSEVTVRDADGREVPGLTKVLSLADAVLANAGSDPDQVRFVALRNSMVNTGVEGDPRADAHPRKRAVWRRSAAARAALLPHHAPARERQPAAQKLRLIAAVERIGREEFPPTADLPGAEVTGFFVLLTNLISSMVRDQWLTFGVATAGIGLMMIVALRSVRLALIALVPNALPIAVVTG